MKLLFLLLFSLSSVKVQAASCCVANTSVPNLMILPSKWQQTFMLANSRVIGEVTPKGQSTFWNKKNKDTTNFARLDLAYSWTEKYQSGFSLRYQNKKRDLNGKEASNSGWSDIGLFQAYQPIKYQRTFIFNSINLPTSNSVNSSTQAMAVDARGTGTYQAGLGIFHLINFRTWDLLMSTETHYTFARTFNQDQGKIEQGQAWGTSVSLGGGYIPWQSKMRYGFTLTPRLEGKKTVKINQQAQTSKPSMVWDAVTNLTYTINESYAVGINYLDQTWFGPARNTYLNRSVSVVIQSHFL